MPRHPPCALHNNSHNTRTTRTTHQKQAPHRYAIRQYHQVNKHTTTKNCITKKRRYSRPLYSSHTTQTAHTTATHSDHPMHHFPRRHNAPDTQQTQQTKPKTLQCLKIFELHQLPTTGQPPNTKHTTNHTKSGWRCQVEHVHSHGMCFSTHKQSLIKTP